MTDHAFDVRGMNYSQTFSVQSAPSYATEKVKWSTGFSLLGPKLGLKALKLGLKLWQL